MSMTKPIAVVTGGAGFIGNNMVDLLLEKGYQVRIIDNLDVGRESNLEGKQFTVVGDGTQCRDFLYVTDVATGFLTAAETDQQGEVYNLGAGILNRRID